MSRCSRSAFRPRSPTLARPDPPFGALGRAHALVFSGVCSRAGGKGDRFGVWRGCGPVRRRRGGGAPCGPGAGWGRTRHLDNDRNWPVYAGISRRTHQRAAPRDYSRSVHPGPEGVSRGGRGLLGAAHRSASGDGRYEGRRGSGGDPPGANGAGVREGARNCHSERTTALHACSTRTLEHLRDSQHDRSGGRSLADRQTLAAAPQSSPGISMAGFTAPPKAADCFRRPSRAHDPCNSSS